jgi:DNA-binding transcriptional LysR family regulator
MTMKRPAAGFRGLNLNLLVALERLLATRSVRLAAEACGVTQSAMSHTLAELRSQLGDALLVRRGNEMLLTPRAEALAVPLADALRGLAQALVPPVPFDPRTTERRFVIAASDVAAITVLPPLMARVAVEAPGVEIVLVPYDRTQIPAALVAGEVDLAVGPPPGDAGAGLSMRALYTSEFVVAMRKGHPAAKQPLDLDAYCALGHVVVSVGGIGRSPIDVLLARRKRTRRIGARVPYFLVAPEIVAATDLVLTAPRQAVVRVAGARGLHLVEPPLPLARTKVAMYFHPRFTDASPHRWLRDVLARADDVVTR